MAKFLKYIVEAKLNGNEAGIKAYSIAVDVFGRPGSFDPQTDPIVRVQARRLRAALEEYYAAEGNGETIRFHLPVGRYVPEFRIGEAGETIESPLPQADELPPATTVAPTRRPILAQIDDIILLVLLVSVALGLALVITQVMAPQPIRLVVPQPPKVAVAEFTSVAAGNEPQASVAGLAVELVTDLSLFPFVDAVYQPRLEIGSTKQALVPFELSGIARGEAGGIQVTASLKRTAADSAIWSMTQVAPSRELATHLDDLSRGFADQLGSINGPLHADAVKWITSTPDVSGNETEYLCGLLYALYRSTAEQNLGERTRLCVNAILARTSVSPHGLAMRGALLLEQTMRQSPLQLDPEPVAEAERLLREALRLLPTSSPIWREYGIFLAATGRVGEAEAAFSSALQLNPANLEAVASYGLLLSQRGASERGAQLASDALGRSAAPPFWFYEAPAINALRAGNDALALQDATLLASGDAELGSVLATVAAQRLGAQDDLNKAISQLLEVSRFRRFGILPILRQRIPDAELRDTIAQALRDAGIDQVSMNGPY